MRKILAKDGKAAGFDFSIPPHMLRHKCGYALAMKGHDTGLIQDYLGHKNIQRVHPNFAKIAECDRQRLIIKNDNQLLPCLSKYEAHKGVSSHDGAR